MSLEETDDISVRIKADDLPEGERLLWQGQPDWWRLAISAFRLRTVAIYFAILTLWRFGSVHNDTGDVALAFAKSVPLVLSFLVAAGLLVAFAALYARTSSFTITDRRIVLRFGVALPAQLNLPLKDIEAAGLKLYRDGTGDIPLTLTGANQPFYLQLWPFARPWKLRAAEPMLRGIPDAEHVASLLARSLATTGGAATMRAAGAPAHESMHETGREPVAA